MSLIITRNFKRAKAQDAAAKDAKFKVGDKVFLRGQGGGVCTIVRIGPKPAPGKYGAGWAEETFDVKRDRDGVMFKGLVETDLRLADNSRAADTKDSARNVKYRGCEITVAYHNPDNVNLSGKTWIVKDVDGVSVGGFSSEAKAKAWIDAHPSRTADSRAADACGTDAKFQKGDKVRVWQYPVYGKMGEVVEATNGSMEYTVNVEGKDYPRIDYRRIVKVSDAAGDAAEFHVGQRVRAKDPAYEYSDGKALGAGMFTVKEVNNNGDVKLDDYGDVWISPSALVEANDACDARDAAPFKVGDLVRMSEGGLTGKITKIEPNGHFRVSFLYNKANGFSQSFSANEIVMVKPAADAEEIAHDSEIVALWQVLGDAKAYLREGKKNHNVKNVLAAAIKAAEKEDPNDRSVAEAKKVLAQFDSAELNNDADLRAALSKMADIAKRLTDAKVSFKAGWTPDVIGEIILEFPNIESARKYNYYKLFNAWEAARSQIVPRWAVNIGGYRVPRIEGNRMTISILHFST